MTPKMRRAMMSNAKIMTNAVATDEDFCSADATDGVGAAGISFADIFNHSKPSVDRKTDAVVVSYQPGRPVLDNVLVVLALTSLSVVSTFSTLCKLSNTSMSARHSSVNFWNLLLHRDSVCVHPSSPCESKILFAQATSSAMSSSTSSEHFTLQLPPASFSPHHHWLPIL